MPDHVRIHKDGIQHLVDYEEKHQGRGKEEESEEQEEKVEFSWLSEDEEIKDDFHIIRLSARENRQLKMFIS